jgi:hypothetical protein
MVEKIKHQIRLQKIMEMKSPTILMNKTDFEDFKKEVESKVVNLKVGLNPTYEGIPIKTSDLIEVGNLVVYDDVKSHYGNP